MKKIYLVLLVLLTSFSLFACVEEDEKEPVPGGDVTLNVAVNFGGTQFISYNQGEPYVGLDGKTYSAGDLSPAWSQIGKNLGINFVDKGYRDYKSVNTDNMFQDAVVRNFDGIDLINSNGANITAERERFVNLKPYIDEGKMPNLKKFLATQSTFESYMTAEDGGIYYTPYLDGNEEVELGFLMRIDWAKKIIDGTTAGDTTPATGLENTTPFNPASLAATTIKVATENAGTRNITKKYNKNIITILKELPANQQTGDGYLQAFRTYMAETYKDQGYAELSDVFVGLDASYFVDELVALMAVVKSNPKLVTNTRTKGPLEEVSVYFPREAKGSRVRNLFRGLEMYGLRGAVSKNNWLYMDDNGKLADSRGTEEGISAISRLNDMYNDGLIIQNLEGTGKENWRDTLLADANGFLMYDYNATQTAKSLVDKAKASDPNYSFQSILPPANAWDGDGNYYHFTESTRSLKNEAWGITKQATRNQETLDKAIKLVDYLYDNETGGADLFLYGPEEWRHETQKVEYQGELIPKFSDAALAEIADPNKGKGNMINYLRDFVGATLPIGHVRSLGLELQTLSEDGLEGYRRVYNAVEAKVLLLAGLQEPEAGMKFNLVPNVFALDKITEEVIKTQKQEFDDFWSDSRLYEIVKNGLGSDYKSKYLETSNNWFHGTYITNYQNVLNGLLGIK